MNNEELIAYWKRMNHAKERLAVRADQLVEFVSDLTTFDPVKLEIERDGRIYYVRLGG